MKSLKVTLLLAVFCLALVGLTNSKQSKTADVEHVEKFDVTSDKIKIANAGHTKKGKPPNS